MPGLSVGRENKIMKKISLIILGIGIITGVFAEISIPLQHVAAPGHVADNTGYGSVNYYYHIGRFEVTNREYTAFLNAIAEVDTNLLWNSKMKISRSGNSGTYTYTSYNGYKSKPVVHVGYYSALRFTNWLHNGQPTGLQDDRSTEDGAYKFTHRYVVSGRQDGAKVWLPSEDEWYKAAYCHPASLGGPASGYWRFATMTDVIPSNDPSVAKSAIYGNFAFPDVVDVGTCTLSQGPWGTFDQNGNVQEMLEVPGHNRGGHYSYGWAAMSSSTRNTFGFALAEGEHFLGFRIATSSDNLPPSDPDETEHFEADIEKAVRISWPSKAGHSYVIEESQDLLSWTAHPDVIEGTGSTIERYYPLSKREQFFRIREN